jgi:hypothetical protein
MNSRELQHKLVMNPPVITFQSSHLQPKTLPRGRVLNWLRGWDLNPRPSGYEPDELPGCSTPRFCSNRKLALFRERATQFVKFLYGFGHFVRMDEKSRRRRRISVAPGSSGIGEAKRTLSL